MSISEPCWAVPETGHGAADTIEARLLFTDPGAIAQVFCWHTLSLRRSAAIWSGIGRVPVIKAQADAQTAQQKAGLEAAADQRKAAQD